MSGHASIALRSVLDEMPGEASLQSAGQQAAMTQQRGVRMDASAAEMFGLKECRTHFMVLYRGHF